MTQGDRWTAILLALAGLLMVVAIILVFGVAPDPSNLVTPVERFSQRIFYFHVPTWWVGFLAFSVAAGSGLLYLITRHERWDVISLSSVEIGVAFTTMGLVTGSIWAKPTWNTWWTWDPRLTTAAIGFLNVAPASRPYLPSSPFCRCPSTLWPSAGGAQFTRLSSVPAQPMPREALPWETPSVWSFSFACLLSPSYTSR
jgi:ABC-type transport system involved in cytochrome c biogenesis permease subunit